MVILNSFNKGYVTLAILVSTISEESNRLQPISPKVRKFEGS